MAEGHLFVDGAYRAGTSGQTHDVVNPATGEVVTTAQLASPEDVDTAVAAAARAQRAWGSATPG
ncbi:MAG: aldehyde dehydrogenase family protein, partial [Candidatus Nanopelagicales bacterium]